MSWESANAESKAGRGGCDKVFQFYCVSRSRRHSEQGFRGCHGGC